MIPDSFIEELRYKLDAEQVISRYVTLKRSGRMLRGLCPFHSEKSPSFYVYPESNSFYCFGCGAGGDLITFIKLAEHLDYVEAIKFLADSVGLAVPEDAADDTTAKRRSRMLELNRETARFYHSVLCSPQGRAGLEYLTNRGIRPETIRHFGLGFAPDGWDALLNHLRDKGFTTQEMLDAAVIRRGRQSEYDQFRRRVIYPIIDLRGTVIGFGGRALGDEKPKYLNSSDTLVFKKSRGLFAMNFAKSTKQPRLILCEGYMDAISIHQAGFDNAVATLGTALTPEQARLISQYTQEVVISYDSDEPGQKATRRASELFAQTGIRVRVLTVTGAKDPDEFIKKYGAEKFRALIEGSESSVEYAIDRAKRKYDLNTDDGKVSFMREFCAIMADTPDKIAADVYITRISRELEISREAIAAKVQALRRANYKREEKKFDSSLRIFTDTLPNQPRDVQRSANIRYARAEDALIAALLRNPDYGSRIIELIGPEEFVTDTNRAIYSVIADRIRTGRPFDAMSLSGELDTVQMSRVSYLMASTREQTFTLDDARELAGVIREKQRERSDEQIAAMGDAELTAYINEIAARKNEPRGNRNE